jgi:hypothetical protein
VFCGDAIEGRTGLGQINVCAPAGTIMLFDHRLLHGTGVNKTPSPRHILIAGFHRRATAAIIHARAIIHAPAGRVGHSHVLLRRFSRTWMRTQEAWLLSAAPAVLERASSRLLQRLGMCAHTIGTVEGHGLGASGAIDDEFSSILAFRRAMDTGSYRRVGVLRPHPDHPDHTPANRGGGDDDGDDDDGADASGVLMDPYTFRTTASGRRAVAKAERFRSITDPAQLARAREMAGGSRYKKRGVGNNELTEASVELPPAAAAAATAATTRSARL